MRVSSFESVLTILRAAEAAKAASVAMITVVKHRHVSLAEAANAQNPQL